MLTLQSERATENDLRRLYAFYARPHAAPFFIDVSGPPPLMRWDDFEEYCTENDAWMLLCEDQSSLLGCAHFRDKQLGLELANFDTVFFNGYPLPNSAEALAFQRTFQAACADQKLSRVQLLTLKSDAQKISFLESIGFKDEGCLREHYFFGSTFHDLIMLGWTTDDRSARMAELAEDDDDDAEELIPAPKTTRVSAPVNASAAQKTGITSRRVDANDEELLIRWYGHPLIQETIEDEELSPDGLRAKARKLAGLDEFQDGECAFIIELDGAPVALTHYMWIDWVSRTGELDYFLAPELGAGPFLAGMVLREIGRIGFEAFALRKLYGFIYGTNDISLRMNANFMQTEAVLKNYLPRAGGGADVHVQSTLASDFAQKFTRRTRSAGPRV